MKELVNYSVNSTEKGIEFAYTTKSGAEFKGYIPTGENLTEYYNTVEECVKGLSNVYFWAYELGLNEDLKNELKEHINRATRKHFKRPQLG